MLASQRLLRLTWLLALAPLLLWGAGAPVAAESGRIEINQTSVDAAGGFPYTISLPGSYVLTSDLIVPGDSDGLRLEADRIVLDLNGFTLRGPSTCMPGACTVGSAIGIFAPNPRFGVSVRNGSVSGFSANCVEVGPGGSVTDMLVTECGDTGIFVWTNTLVTANRVQNTGFRGIDHARSSLAIDNVVAAAALADSNGSAFRRNRFSGGNVCDDTSCSRVVSRHYYLTSGTFQGNHGGGVCEPGFHMASITELIGQPGLVYDTANGLTYSDSGAGAPTTERGWIRNGNASDIFSNCSGWTSNSASATADVLFFPFSHQNDLPATNSAPFVRVANRLACSTLQRAWCVED